MDFGFSIKADIFSSQQGILLARELGANVIQTCLYPDGKYKYKLVHEDFERYNNIQHLDVSYVAHGILSTNLASSVPKVVNFSRSVVIGELFNASTFKIKNLVLHPGSNADKNAGIQNLATSLNFIFNKVLPYKSLEALPNICIETMAGAGNLLCSSPSDFVQLFDLLKDHSYLSKVSICLDSAHIWGAGYLPEDYFNLFEKYGLNDKVKVVHFNNSQVSFGSKKDRHALLFDGKISSDYLKFLVKHYPQAEIVIETIASDKELLKQEISYFHSLL